MTGPPEQPPPQDPPEGAGQFGRWMKLLAWLGGAFAQWFPAAAYFFEYAPPFFPGAANPSVGVGAFIWVIGVFVLYLSFRREQGHPNSLLRGLICVFMAVSVLVVYMIMLTYWTVSPPADQKGGRRQIGFYMSPLTAEAEATIKRLEGMDPPIEVRTPTDLMGVFGAWGEAGRTDEIWQLWSIIVAGSLLVVTFVVALVFWAYGLGALLRYLEDQHAQGGGGG